jgi:hypothetical protein
VVPIGVLNPLDPGVARIVERVQSVQPLRVRSGERDDAGTRQPSPVERPENAIATVSLRP